LVVVFNHSVMRCLYEQVRCRKPYLKGPIKNETLAKKLPARTHSVVVFECKLSTMGLVQRIGPPKGGKWQVNILQNNSETPDAD
jgi:hypothetical protein